MLLPPPPNSSMNPFGWPPYPPTARTSSPGVPRLLREDDGPGGAGGPIPPLAVDGVPFTEEGLSAEGVCPPSDARDARSRMRELPGRVPTEARREEGTGLFPFGVESGLGTYRPVESRTRGRPGGAEAESPSSPSPFMYNCLLRLLVRLLLLTEGCSSAALSSDGRGIAQGSVDGAIAGSASASSFSFIARLSRASATDSGAGITSTKGKRRVHEDGDRNTHLEQSQTHGSSERRWLQQPVRGDRESKISQTDQHRGSTPAVVPPGRLCASQHAQAF